MKPKPADFLRIASFPAIVFLIHLIIASLGFYQKYPLIDIPMHFLGGASIALSSMLIIKTLIRKKTMGKTNIFVLFFFTVSAVSLIAVFWEFFEFFVDINLGTAVQIGLTDTLGDLFMGIFGGSVSFLLFYPKALL